ncbi:restriction endonuclease [Pedobacter aquatilis]|uniref:restriction endonuclease n=1 Tax=Pedobacter aquatilis TaxID=351343 RepID=UPI0025B55B32|nr:restriction endonuclease [Pedobacter aquatilis]MDN3586089.1 restriction endonuclease [Pedobacter aquatilis]
MPEKKKTIEEFLTDACYAFGLSYSIKDENAFSIRTDEATGLNAVIRLEEKNLSFYFMVRTYDVVHHGDRTDVHVIISLMFAAFIRILGDGISCQLFDIPHAVCDNEVGGRYIVPLQTPGYLGAASEQDKQDKISMLCYLMGAWRNWFWHYASCPCAECLKREGIDNHREYNLPSEMEDAINNIFKPPSISNYGNRSRPNWHYIYDIDHEVTIIKSREMARFFKSYKDNSKRSYKTVKGISGTLIKDGELANYISSKASVEFKKIIEKLSGKKVKTLPRLFPLENMIITSYGSYIIALGRLCGIHEFKKHREKLRTRHNAESEVLFPIPVFDWAENPCPEQFEKMVKALLEREPNVVNIRIPAPINQGDRGRDLIIEWRITGSEASTRQTDINAAIMVVGQCKASGSSVSKSKVQDIRDTVETHDAKGYFLAVSTQITEPLTAKLEDLKKKGIWTEWWNREEIEYRLNKNQELISLYPKVLKATSKVKFVDRENSL